jgi:hypothetical protein
MLKIEDKIKQKLASNWNSVRRAFLDLDIDYDGFINEFELANLIGGENDM